MGKSKKLTNLHKIKVGLFIVYFVRQNSKGQTLKILPLGFPIITDLFIIVKYCTAAVAEQDS